MKIPIRSCCALAIIIPLATVSPAYALNKWQSGLVGALAMAATIVAIEHGIIPFLGEISQNSLNNRAAAQLAENEQKIQELKHDYTNKSFAAKDKSEELLKAKQKTMHDLHAIQSTYEAYKSSQLEKAEAFLKEIEACNQIVQQHNAALDQAIAQSVSEEACAAYKEELDALNAKGLNQETIKRIIVEKYVRDPYRHHTYLNTLDQWIERCQRCKVAPSVTDSLEQVHKTVSRATATNIEEERHAREAAAHQEQEFNLKMASKRSAKEFFDAAKQDLGEVRTSLAQAHNQLEEFEQLMQNQRIDSEHAIAMCTTAAHNAAITLQQVNNDQQQLRQQLIQLGQMIRDQSDQTQAGIHTILDNLVAQSFPANNPQQPGAQGYNGPSAPPFD